MNSLCKQLFFLLLIVVMCTKHSVCAVNNVVKQPETDNRKCLTCKPPRPIFAKDINDKGFKITVPGVYCLDADTVFNPCKRGLSAIVINVPAGKSSDVVIDLDNKTLSQGNTTKSTIGILVKSQTNVIIKNGSVHNFTLDGIQAKNSDQLILQGLNVFNCGTSQGNQLGGGVVLLNSNNISLTDVNARENIGVGIGLSGVDNFFMNQCHCDGNTGFANIPIFGNSVFGFAAYVIGVPPFTSPSSNLFITNSTFNNNTATDSAFAALVGNLTPTPVGRPTNIVFDNCVANDTASTGTTGQFTEAITVLADDVIISNCTVNGLTNNGTSANHVVGIQVSLANNVLIENCTVSNLVGTAIYVHGFDIEGNGINVTHKNCVAYNVTNNSTSATSLALGFGILKPLGIPGFDILGQGTVVDSCIAQNVTAPFGAIAAGILVNAQKNVLIQNCVSSNNGYGILAKDILSPTLVSSNGIIRGNTLENNSIAGISDQTTANHSYIDNTARSNGLNGTSNYVGSIFPMLTSCTPCVSANTTPVLLWKIPGAPCPLDSNCVAANKLDNLDIRP